VRHNDVAPTIDPSVDRLLQRNRLVRGHDVRREDDRPAHEPEHCEVHDSSGIRTVEMDDIGAQATSGDGHGHRVRHGLELQRDTKEHTGQQPPTRRRETSDPSSDLDV
jgi:hypothetical protein